ncbi:putative membrane protein [Methanomethylovorans hollandica DSM 15978]|uniref:Putative membrane protein n=1 Tax=Methanomethylovorans hollandica (strain DSM 15978 / NBRC 107637 / DMS1) TaxID=867904 RepID=L0KW25_METHD|nr:DUF131 domain-containing protein [Methanomethylovorans hollandica]AGB48880.1 putative membrane protein [Methanomethylovorans hollandica DSM 15978]
MASSRDIIRIGYYLISIGVLLLFAGSFFSTMHSDRDTGNSGGLILIGPIPIVFGSSPQITTYMLYAGFFMFLIYIFIRRKM